MDETGEQKENLLLDSDDSEILENEDKIIEKKDTLNYYDESFLNKIFFNWTSKIMDLSNKGKIKITDLNSLKENQSTRHHVYPLEETWKSESKNSKYPLLITILRIHLVQLLQLFLIDFFYQIIKLIKIYFFRQIIFHFSTGNFNSNIKYDNNSSFIEFIENYQFNIYLCGFFLILIKLLGSTIYHICEFKEIIVQKRIRNEMTGLIFNKILRGNLYDYEGKEDEKISLIENDCDKLGYIFYIIPKIMNAPLILFITLYFLFKLFGYKFIYSIVLLFISMGIILLLDYLYFKNTKKILKRKEKRIKLVTYVFHILKI